MSLKENVEFIKEELSTEEQFFEKAVITERFVKKYKKPLIAIFIAIVIVALGNVVYTVKEQKRIEDANAKLAVLLKNPTDTKVQNELKSLSPKLYAIWSFSNAVVHNDTQTLQQLSSKKLPVVNDMAAYEAAARKGDISKLSEYELKQSAIYKDLAIVEEAIFYLNKNKRKKAKEKLALIDENSPLSGVVKILMHYGVQ